MLLRVCSGLNEMIIGEVDTSLLVLNTCTEEYWGISTILDVHYLVQFPHSLCARAAVLHCSKFIKVEARVVALRTWYNIIVLECKLKIV